MNHKLKNLGMAIVATLTMAALAAPAASGAEFHAGLVYSLTGNQVGEDTTTFNVGTAKCKKIDYTGELSTATSSTLTLAPSFSECTAFGFVNSSVDANGCEYVFHTGAEGSTEIDCPAGKSIVFTGFNCWVTVGPQSLKSVTYTNEEAEGSNDVRISLKLTSMSYTQHSKSFPYCGSGVPKDGTFNNGTSNGAITLEATVKDAGIWYE